MATFIEMPKLSDTMTEGVLLKWLKNEGDVIEIGDILAEVETDKATMEMEAFDEGTLGKIYVNAGEKIPIGAPLAVLVEEGEEIPDAPSAVAAAAPVAQESGNGAAPAAPAAAAPVSAVAGGGGRVKASPLARKIAAERGVNLAAVQGTGPGGRIIKDDVLAAGTGGGAAVAAPAAILAKAGAADQKIPLTGMRTVIAERLLASKTQIPHFYLHTEVDAAPLMALRKQINVATENDETANKYTVNDFVLKAVIAAAVEVPQVNASFAGDHVIQFGSVQLSVAVAVDDGLVTPVVRDAQTKSLLEVSQAVKDLADRARNKKLKPDEMQGGTITVSSLGAFGITTFDAIINPPQAAILSIGAIVSKPVVENGAVVPGLRMDVGLSCDHRVVDGAVGASYLAELRKFLEQPALMLV